jgi:hypothetical protein
MEPKGKLEVLAPSPHGLRSKDKRQTSDEELDDVRRRGHYVVLPPFEGTQEEDWEDLILSEVLLIMV